MDTHTHRCKAMQTRLMNERNWSGFGGPSKGRSRCYYLRCTDSLANIASCSFGLAVKNTGADLHLLTSKDGYRRRCGWLSEEISERTQMQAASHPFIIGKITNNSTNIFLNGRLGVVFLLLATLWLTRRANRLLARMARNPKA